MQDICKKYPISEDEYTLLHQKFGDLNHYIAWQLYNKNTRNNHTDEQEDISQELTLSLLRAGSYYKRQVYIERSLELCYKFVEGKMERKVLRQLKRLWLNKKRHGAGRQKFGPPEEMVLQRLLRTYVPRECRPNRKAPLKIDAQFATYCKSIVWNTQKTMGKKITKAKQIRGTMVSLSEFDYLGGQF